MMAAFGPVTYDALMGLTGLAFVVSVEPGFAHDPLAELRSGRIVDTLAALGLDGEPAELDSPEAVVPTVREAVDAGFAVPLLGWPQASDDWALIAGYDTGRGVLCGRPADGSEDAYLGAPPRGHAAVIVRGRIAPTDKREAATEALQWAARRAQDTAQAYETWRAMLGEGGPGTDQPKFETWLHDHEALAETLADARASAAEFVRHCAAGLGPAAGEGLNRAAEGYDAIADLLDAREPSIFGDGIAHCLASESWRAEWSLQIGEIAAIEAEALETIRLALSGGPTSGDYSDAVP